MARRFTLVENTDSTPVALPDGFMPGTVAPFVMRYGTDFLVAMQRAAASHDAANAPAEIEPA
jgi:hypothetical protein